MDNIERSCRENGDKAGFTIPLRSLLVAASLVLSLSCRERIKGVGLLPPATADRIEVNVHQVKNPYKEISPGVAARTIFATDDYPAYHIEIQDAIVAPGKGNKSFSLPEAAFIEVIGGKVEIGPPEARKELTVGSTFTVAAGETLNITNLGGVQAQLRLLVIKPQ